MERITLNIWIVEINRFVNDLAKIDENILKKSGVIGIIYRELNIQLVFGLRHQT